MQHVQLRIRGRVQGVGFRWFAQSEAERLGLTGTVRNCPDGSVEVEAEGSRTSLDRLIAVLRRGPVAARVSDMGIAWSEGPSRHKGFRIGF